MLDFVRQRSLQGIAWIDQPAIHSILHGLLREKHMRADRATFLIILRNTLRALLVREHAVCQLPKSESSSSNDAMPVAVTATQSCRSICGKPLGRHARHACHCPCGLHRVAAHNSVVNALAHTLSKAGGSVQTESFIPELYMKRANGTWQEAVMDIAVSWPLAPTLRFLYITLRSSHYRGAASGAGAAHRDAPTTGCREPDRAQMAGSQRPAPTCA